MALRSPVTTPPRAILVDLFGTLVPKWSGEGSTRAKRAMARHVGVDEDAFIHAWNARWWDRELGRISTEESIDGILRALAPEAAEHATAALFAIWADHVREQLSPRPEALDALAAARKAGLRVGLVSNAGPTVPALFAETPLAPIVECAAFSCTVGVAKPDPAIYEFAARTLSVPPERCLYLGDGGDDELQGAERLGMAAVLLKIESEIAREGLPASAAAWSGPVIHSFCEIVQWFGPPREPGDPSTGPGEDGPRADPRLQAG